MNEKTKSKSVVGVDISLDTTTLAVVDIRGNILGTDSFSTTDHPTPTDFVACLTERILTLVENYGGYENIRSVGISAPSGNFQTGCIENPPNLPWPGNTPLAAMLRDRVGVSVAVGNDAHTTALGEYVFGSAHGMKNFIVVTLGHGLGSCIFVDGKPYLGKSGFAGEVGHSVLVDRGRRCACGQEGCFEAYCGERGVLYTAKEVMAEHPEVESLMRNCENLTPKQVSIFCEQGDSLAIETYRRTGYYLGWGLANVATTTNPEAIIVAGGISHAGHWLLDTARESFDQHVFRNIRGKVAIEQSLLEGRERDVLGASALAWEVPEYSLFK